MNANVLVLQKRVPSAAFLATLLLPRVPMATLGIEESAGQAGRYGSSSRHAA